MASGQLKLAELGLKPAIFRQRSPFGAHLSKAGYMEIIIGTIAVFAVVAVMGVVCACILSGKVAEGEEGR